MKRMRLLVYNYILNHIEKFKRLRSKRLLGKRLKMTNCLHASTQFHLMNKYGVRVNSS